jgi:uncharacterized membrane protein
MVIITGFPPSSSISPGPRIACTEKETKRLKEANLRQCFSYMDAEFVVFAISGTLVEGVCYQAASGYIAGNIYCFNQDVEVVLFSSLF